MKEKQCALSECHIPSKNLQVLDSTMHYLHAGEGDPILFLHGMPTSSYLWRNIIPTLSDSGSCIAPDLIGMGQSGKPEIEYRIFDHIRYIEAFIDELGLTNLTIVMHGWGSLIGFDYARRHPDKVKALAFFEAHIRPTTDWAMLSLPVQQFASLLAKPGASYHAVVEQNYLIKKLLPRGVIRDLTEEEVQAYTEPFATMESRKPLWQYVNDLPLGKGPQDVVDLMQDYCAWLQRTEIPKLMMYAVPGFITTMETVQWAKTHLPALTLATLDDALHFAQESEPKLFARTLRDWYLNSVK